MDILTILRHESQKENWKHSLPAYLQQLFEMNLKKRIESESLDLGQGAVSPQQNLKKRIESEGHCKEVS